MAYSHPDARRTLAAGLTPQYSMTEARMGQVFKGFFQTLVFVGVVIAILFGIFTLVSYLTGPVGG